MAKRDTMYNFNQGEKKPKQGKKTFVYIIVFILLITNAWFLMQFMKSDSKFSEQEKAYNSIKMEKDSLNAELQQLATEFDKTKQENIALQSKLVDKDNEIQNKVIEIRKLIDKINTAKVVVAPGKNVAADLGHDSQVQQINKASAEMSKLRELNTKYLATINLLSNQNKELSNQNKVLNDQNATLVSTLSQEKDRSNALAQKNEALTQKINSGAALKIQGLKSDGIKFKGNGVEVATNKAKSAEKIKVCFTVLENVLTEKGPKSIYLRIMGPDGSALSTINQTIPYRGININYTAKQVMSYENRDTEICFYWTKGAAYDKGAYTAEVYSEGNQLGVARFNLE